MSSIFVRILTSFFLLFSILFLPFWVSIILALTGMIYFSKFFEAPVLFLLLDLLYGVREVKFYNMVFVFFIIVTILLVIIEVLKKKLKFYN